MNTRFGDVKEPNTNKSIKIQEDDELKNENDVHNENDNMNRFVLTVSQNRPTFNTIEIKFMTRDAVRLIDPEIIPQGKKKTFLPAIRSFDTRINKIINASRQDDPFADQVLLDTERAINHFNETITEQTNGLRSQIKALFELNEAKLKLDNNAHAFTVNVNLKNNLSTAMLWSLKHLDTMLYLVFQAEKHCVISSQQSRIYRQEAKKDFRSLLGLNSSWKNTSISREDIAQKTQRTAKAFEDNHLINLSLEVLLLDIRADSAPRITRRDNNFMSTATREKILSIYNGVTEESDDETIDSDNIETNKSSKEQATS